MRVSSSLASPLRTPGSPDSHRVRSSSAAPLPVTVTVYNLFVPSKKGDESKKGLMRPEYTADLLVPVRLDVVFASASKEDLDADDDQADDDILMFSSVNDRGGIHPSWDHLNERIEVFNDGGNSVYKSMRLRVVATTHETTRTDPLIDIPLHPSRLRRLPEDASSPEEEGGGMVAWEQRPPPKQLPPNAVLIDYTDGSTRVHPPLYHKLVERHVIVEPDPRDASLLQDENEEHRRQSRFTDDVFDTLDQVTWDTVPQSNQRPSPSSLLETDDESKAVPVKSLSDDDADLISDEFAETLMLGSGARGVVDVEERRKLAELVFGEADAGSFLPIELESAISDLKSEKEELEQLIAEEESRMQQDLEALHENESCLRALMDSAKHAEEETTMIEEDTKVARRKQAEIDFCLDAHRIKLLKELQFIYPIRCQAENTYVIRGQEIPSDLHGGNVSDDEISAALGFLCHTLIMMSKYLSIALRYRIVCNSSRSAVQEDAVTILPLFQARVVERDELDRAMVLLHRNVDCILKTRGIQYEEHSHVLAKVQRIYDGVVDGR